MKHLFTLYIALLLGASGAWTQNPGLVISEIYCNPPGSDSPFEWVELKALKNIDFSQQPYTIVVNNNGTATGNGWVEGGSITYAFQINSGSITAGQVAYVGGSQMAPTGIQLRSIHTGTTAGDGFGNANAGGVFGNGGSNADGIAVFALPVASITPTSVPVDALFYGTAAGGAVVNGGADGYELPLNDFYGGGKLQSTSLILADPGANYLELSGVYDTTLQQWTTPRTAAYPSNFTNGSSSVQIAQPNPPVVVQMVSDFQVVQENVGNHNVLLTVSNVDNNPTIVVFEVLGYSTANVTSDFNYSSDTLVIPAGTQGNIAFPIQIIDDNFAERDESIVLRIQSVINGVKGSLDYQILFIKDNDYQAPSASNDLLLELVTSFSNGPAGANSAEIVSFDTLTKRMYVANSVAAKLDIIDFSNTPTPVLLNSISIASYGNINSVAAHNGTVAMAIENSNPQDNGFVVFLDSNGTFLNQVTVGAMPDMITYNLDHSLLLTANEGEPNASYSVDPEGSISIINMSTGVANLTNADVTTLNFQSFNSQINTLKSQGLRVFNPSQILSLDLEPEYITILPDNQTAIVTLQENNAVAVVNLAIPAITEIRPLGKMDFAQGGMDASDQSGAILISSFPVKGLFMPDAIASAEINGTPYYFTANEGDARENNVVTDVARINSLPLDSVLYPHQNILKNNKFLGRLNAVTQTGDLDGDGDYDEIQVLGTRSFTIWNAQSGALVFDSKDLIERIISNSPEFSSLFNASNSNDNLKNRSDDKGPEPEGVAYAMIDGDHYLFVGLERIGGAMIFKINNPSAPQYVSYVNNRTAGSNGPDLGTEGILFISSEESADGHAYLVLANEVSSTLSIYRVSTCTETIAANLGLNQNPICEEDSTLISVEPTGNTSYQWQLYGAPLASTSNQLYINQAGIYSVVASSVDFECTSKTQTVELFVNEKPQFDLGNDVQICPSQLPVTIAGPSGFIEYLWTGGIQTQNATYNQAGNYILTVTDANGCSNSDSVLVTVNPCLGLDELEETIQVYPIPTSHTLQIAVENQDWTNYLVHDLNGRKLLNGPLSPGVNSIDFKSLHDGTYIVTLMGKTKTTTIRTQKN